MLLTCLTTVLNAAAVDVNRICQGEFDRHEFCITGVVSDVQRDQFDPLSNFFALRTKTGTIGVHVPEKRLTISQLKSLIDAEIEVHGKAVRFEFWRGGSSSFISPFRDNGLTVLRAPPTNPFVAVGQTTHLPHREVESGTVIHVGSRRIFISDHLKVIEVRLADGVPVPPFGTLVTVAGFPRKGPFVNQLTEAVVREDRSSPAENLTILPLCAEDLLVSYRLPVHIPAEGNHSKTIRISGVFKKTPKGFSQDNRFTLECGLTSLSVDVSDVGPQAVEGIESGSTVEVTGLCLMEFETATPTIPVPQFRRVTLIPSTTDDIRVLARPPWWTPARLSIVVCILLAALVAILLWNASLRILAERRSRALLKAQIGSITSQLKVDERTRLAIELHDSIAQTLACVAMEMETAGQLTDGDEVRRHVGIAERTLKSCRDEIRDCLWDLRSSALEETDMNAAIRRALQPHIRNVELKVRFNVPRKVFSDNTAYAVIKIIRELALNGIRHGRATLIRVAGGIENGRLLFSVRDNGCGFNPDTAPGPLQGHFGLAGVRERLRRLLGTLAVESAPGQGTRATVTVKVSQSAESASGK